MLMYILRHISLQKISYPMQVILNVQKKKNKLINNGDN
jgi:hypothetical protein